MDGLGSTTAEFGVVDSFGIGGEERCLKIFVSDPRSVDVIPTMNQTMLQEKSRNVSLAIGHTKNGPNKRQINKRANPGFTTVGVTSRPICVVFVFFTRQPTRKSIHVSQSKRSRSHRSLNDIDCFVVTIDPMNSTNRANNVPVSNGTPSASSSDAPNADEQLNRINLQALQNRDPYITKIVDQAQRVCVFKFVAEKREWVSVILALVPY